ncbi:MAG TPA: response regulator, partial [Gammaproteobacteria bacterium]
VSVRREAGMLAVAVRDNGIGMSEKALTGIFELFAQNAPTLDRNDSGLGIGLTLVKVLAEMHDGSIEAKSEGPGQGSEFTLRLPLGEKPQARPVAAAPAISAAGSSHRVLVVDDNRDSAETLAQLLEIMNHQVQTAHDGPAAIKAAIAFRPDVILLDIGLPGLSGYEVARRLRQEPELKQILLIAVSGYCQEEDRQRSRKAGFDHHLAKPIDHQTLIALLTE